MTKKIREKMEMILKGIPSTKILFLLSAGIIVIGLLYVIFMFLISK
jgi:hypothetical protein